MAQKQPNPRDWQQSLLRVGINYNLNPRVVFRLGYARVETYPYGDYTINEFGKQFSEDRIFQMFQLSHKEGNIDFSHRFILEQRFIGAYSSADQTTEDKLLTSNRARYLFKFFLPLSFSNPKKNAWYTAFSNEVFINFGQNIQHNIFDQNRISILLGYRMNKNIRVEGGYLNQIVQFGRLIDNCPLLQFNNEIILNTYFNIDLTKREETQKHLDETQ